MKKLQRSSDHPILKYYSAVLVLTHISLFLSNNLKYNFLIITILKTRMHSSGMRTACLLTVPIMHCASRCLIRGCLPGGCLPRGYLPGGCLPRGVSAKGVFVQGVSAQGEGVQWGSMQWGRHPSCGQTDTCDNITFTNFACGW